MTDTEVTSARPLLLDEGIGGVPDDNERWVSAGVAGTIALATGIGNYHSLDFTGHDGGENTVNLTTGYAHILVSGVLTQSVLGGVSPPGYDDTLPFSIFESIVFPSTVSDIPLTSGSLNDVWVAFDTDGTGPGDAGSVYVRSGTGLTAPSHPNVKVGQANPDNPGSDARVNLYPDADYGVLSAKESFEDPSGTVHTTELANLDDVAGGGGWNVDPITSGVSAQDGFLYWADPRTVAIDVELPSPTANARVAAARLYSDNAVTLSPNAGEDINGVSGSITVPPPVTEGGEAFVVAVISDGTEWRTI